MDPKKINSLFEQQRQIHAEGVHDNKLRIFLLQKVNKILISYEKSIVDTLKEDLGKHPVESYTSEYLSLVNELYYISKNLKRWMCPKKSMVHLFL